jgi:CubicO group peptidase (beta-lactamase class C family)
MTTRPRWSPSRLGRHGLRVCCVVSIVGLALVLGPTAPVSAGSSPGVTDYSTVITKLKTAIPSLMKAGGTVGLTVALVDGNRTVWLRGFGSADRARNVPVTQNTLLHIGSVSKTMTAAAVMQLVQEGRVKLDAPLARSVPGFSLRPRFHHSVITVRSVLDHHSGIPGDLFNGLFTAGKPNPG